MEKPKWLETLTSHSPPLFQSTNKLQRIFQSCVEVKREREGEWGKEKLTFNLSFSCYVHLHSHDVQTKTGVITAELHDKFYGLWQQGYMWGQ